MNPLLQQAQEAFRYGKFAEAVDLARQALAESPHDAEAHSVLGTSLSRLNRQQEADEALLQAIRLAPAAARHQYNYAAHKFAVGDRESARIAAQAAVQLEPGHGPALDLLARIASEAAPFAANYGPQAPAPTPYPPRQRLPFVESLGWSWSVLGWFFFAALFVSRVVLQVRMAKLSGVSGDNLSQAMEVAETIFRESGALLVAVMVWYGLLCIWWAFDLTDRRPPSGLVTASIVAMAAFLCCPWFAIVWFPAYYFMRLRVPRF